MKVKIDIKYEIEIDDDNKKLCGVMCDSFRRMYSKSDGKPYCYIYMIMLELTDDGCDYIRCEGCIKNDNN